jgi:hypothetical protein
MFYHDSLRTHSLGSEAGELANTAHQERGFSAGCQVPGHRREKKHARQTGDRLRVSFLVSFPTAHFL